MGCKLREDQHVKEKLQIQEGILKIQIVELFGKIHFLACFICKEIEATEEDLNQRLYYFMQQEIQRQVASQVSNLVLCHIPWSSQGTLFHCVTYPGLPGELRFIGLLGQTASGYKIAATKPATYAEDTNLRQKEEVLKANIPFEKPILLSP